MASVIELIPASEAFVANRTTSLGAWVLSGFLDSILLGVVLSQVGTFFKSGRSQEGLGRHYRWLVVVLTFLSILKTSQSIAIVWIQNVEDFMNPDVARLLVAKAWWCRHSRFNSLFQTGVIGILVQSFFALRFYMLVRNVFLILPIVATMLLGFAAICLQMNSILVGDAKAKVMWLLVHLVCVFLTDLFNTVGTCYALRSRDSSGLSSTSSLIHRLLLLVFESAIPPTVVAAIDLIMTQTLDSKHLLWHLLLNFALAKLYVISLLYTLNSINEYRKNVLSGDRVTSSGSRGHHGARSGTGKRGDVELAHVRSKPDQIYVQTQVVTHVSPSSQGSIENEERAGDVKLSGWQPNWSK
ncbi:hypothetical protein DFH08DRAFT_388896 [Mycena albidolilacea]|uniref:DUF6534 domain-containing protein n=1 Tax=Mycena albidolilacea TaxID=1033008 RepID=A0AAD6ZFQ2_9AGAR|nr:hypothetical protein DFH08DRAFT_388896 [Mycena albidolilacea]